MTPSEIILNRLINQQIATPVYTSPKDLTNWMGALQAQDYNMVKWAIGMRLKDCNENTVQDAINKGELIRTHVLRPTWHFVSSDDVYWMLALNAEKIKSSMRARHNFLGLNPEIIKKSQSKIIKMLEEVDFLERDEIINRLFETKIVSDTHQVYHILTFSELDGLICSGPEINNKPTFTLLEKRVPVKIKYTREESIALLTKKYFQSHGPATIKDFVWWSGLNNTEAKKGIEMNKPEIKFVTEGMDNYWYFAENSDTGIDNYQIYLLPAFDEFIISYRERKFIIADDNYSKLISNNGIFRPVIIFKRQAIGTWKRTVRKKTKEIDLLLFENTMKLSAKSLRQSLKKYQEYKN